MSSRRSSGPRSSARRSFWRSSGGRPNMAASTIEVHHRVPRCLLGFFDRAASGELDGAGLQAWFEWEEEAFRYGVGPGVSRGELAALIEGSAVEIPEERHKASHSTAGDFVR